MKAIIAGSREGIPESEVFYWMNKYSEQMEITEVVCGMARGVDLLGKTWAYLHGIPVKEFPARWRKPDGSTDRAAGYKRNAEMANYADICFVFWDGKSKGTKHMMTLAKQKKLPVFLTLITTEQQGT